MKNVLVTGGAGYIGGHVCKELYDSGYTPVVIDNLSTGHKRNVKWGPLIETDLRDKKKLIEQVTKMKFLGVIHLAASAYVGESEEFPLKYFENNIISTINLLSAMEVLDVRRLVFSSSCSTYGIGNGKPFLESDPQEPMNNYGISKLMCEQIIKQTSLNNSLSNVILRYFNACGADYKSGIWEEHNPETHVIPLLVESFRNQTPFKVFGVDHETEDGSAIRDYVHVSDLARAHVKALELPLEDGCSIAINLGSGVGTSVLQLIEYVKSMGYSTPICFQPRRKGDPSSLIANIDLAKELLMWNPKSSSLNKIFSSVFNSRTFSDLSDKII